MNSKFFTFINPYLSFIDSGNLFRRPFNWLYTVLAIFNLILPLFIFYQAIDNNIFDAPTKFIIVFFLVWLAIAFASWIGFQILWDRKSKVGAVTSDDKEFIATPVFSHFIQTMGEWIGTWVAIVGFSVALLGTIILGDDAGYFSRQLGVGFLSTGFVAIIIMPVYGFLIIVGARFISEQFKALISIANNTKKP